MTESQSPKPKRDIDNLVSLEQIFSLASVIRDEAADVLKEQERELVYGREGRFAGYFTELPSAMSYRLWEQGGHEPKGDDVALYEANLDGHGIDALVRAAKEYRTLREVARRAVAAWDCTALPHRDGMLQERMDNLRTACSRGRLELTRDKHGPV